jgi:adenylate cyclase, class 2
MLEIEAKYPIEDDAAFLERLNAWGAALVEDRGEADHYFSAPDRDFAATDEAFRIRRIGNRNYLTYKGPKIDAVTKTRNEIEVAIAEGADAASDTMRLFQELGYRPVAIVQKRRKIFELERGGFTLHFCLDDVEGVGRYVEIEIVADESQYTNARDVLQKAAAEMGFGQSERRSYLSMLLAKVADDKSHVPAKSK